jgi:predicted pyridoxine 5'-phosphate oxidase superfamily flavin-nucleotide-binding protein
MAHAHLDASVRDFCQRTVLCWLATVSADGQPNVSPKELFAVVDDDHLVIANLASPVSATNIRAEPRVCVSLIDVFVQKGFKLMGHATDIRTDEPEFAQWAAPVLNQAGDRFTVRSVFRVRVQAVTPILAPSYRFYPEQTTEAAQVESALRAYGVVRRPDR